MTIGLYDPERRYRRRLWAGIVRVGFYIATLILVGLFAYQIGVERVEVREDRVQDRIALLEAANSRLEQEGIRLQAQARAAQIQYNELFQRFEREVPLGIKRELAELVTSLLDQGVAPERLAFVIGNAAQPRNCVEPETKRFIMPTPAYRGANTSVGFADNRITVTGTGANAVAENGGVQGWFDPAQTVTLTFSVIGGNSSAVSGLLPLHHSLVLGDREYRFSVVEGERSFVNVTADNCEFP